MHWGWSFMCQLWLLFMFSFLSLPFSAEAVLEVSLFSFSRFCPVVSSKAVCGRRLGSVSFLCLLSSLLCFYSSGSVSGRRCGNVSFLSPHFSVLCFFNSCLHWKTWQNVSFLSLLWFFFFSSAGFISANGIYKWKGTTFFAIFEELAVDIGRLCRLSHFFLLSWIFIKSCLYFKALQTASFLFSCIFIKSCLHWKALQTISFLSALLDFHQKLSALEGFADCLISFCSLVFSSKAVCIGRLCRLSRFFLLSCIFIKSCLHWKALQTVSFLSSFLYFHQKLSALEGSAERTRVFLFLSLQCFY